MNPLDKQELQPFLRNLKEEMPIHTETTAKIKRSYSQGMPKNLMEYSAFVNNHFLNDNLAIIEEMQHRNKLHPIPKWFREYQLRHYAKYGILKGDHFFGPFAKIFPDLGEHRAIGYLPFATNILGFGTIGDTKVFGSELTTGQSGTGGQNPDKLHICQTNTNGSLGSFYDRIAYNNTSGTGNMRLGCYDDVGGEPANLQAELGSTVMDTSYTWQTLTEFALATVVVWLAVNRSAIGVSGETNVNVRNKDFAFGALPNPAGSGYASGVQVRTMKIGHT